MSKTILILETLWFLRTFKYVLFWLYLWQLKEYHIGRYADHFRTQKGKKLVFNFLLLFKILLLAVLLSSNAVNSSLYYILVLVYFAETLLFFSQLYKKTLKKPVSTIKSLFLTIVSFAVLILFTIWSLNKNITWLLAFDILLPIIISAIVLVFQPIAVITRNNILKNAKKKLAEFPNVKVIAITGSYGKTSTKEFLTTILSEKFKVLSTNKHQNSEIGIAKCILNDLNSNHEIFIAEVGAYNKGKVKEVCGILKPKIGIVTGVNEQHMALFGSMENLLSAEGGGELDQALPQDGILVLNADNKYCLDLFKKTKHKTKIYSQSNTKIGADIWTETILVTESSISFVAQSKNGQMSNFSVNVLGKHNVQNLLGAILTANELGMNFGEILKAVEHIKQEQAGMTLNTEKHGINIIDSSYSSNPDGAIADLDYLSVFKNKRVIVMPCLIELGKKSGYTHEQIGKKIGKACNMAIITTKDHFEKIKKGAMESGMNSSNILLCDNPPDIYSIITLFCKHGDAVLLEGRVPNKLIELLK